MATVSYTPTTPTPGTPLNLMFNLKFNTTLYHTDVLAITIPYFAYHPVYQTESPLYTWPGDSLATYTTSSVTITEMYYHTNFKQLRFILGADVAALTLITISITVSAGIQVISSIPTNAFQLVVASSRRSPPSPPSLPCSSSPHLLPPRTFSLTLTLNPCLFLVLSPNPPPPTHSISSASPSGVLGRSLGSQDLRQGSLGGYPLTTTCIGFCLTNNFSYSSIFAGEPMTMKFWTSFSVPILANATLQLQVDSFNYTMPVYFKIRFTDNITAGFNETKANRIATAVPITPANAGDYQPPPLLAIKAPFAIIKNSPIEITIIGLSFRNRSVHLLPQLIVNSQYLGRRVLDIPLPPVIYDPIKFTQSIISVCPSYPLLSPPAPSYPSLFLTIFK